MNRRCENTLNTALGIEYTSVGSDFLEASMPVNKNTIQPYGLLNGGASMGLIESLASMAANLTLDHSKFVAVGQHISGHHFKPARDGEKVVGRATPLHLGKTSQVWEVVIRKEDGTMVCKGSLTMAVIPLERIRG